MNAVLPIHSPFNTLRSAPPQSRPEGSEEPASLPAPLKKADGSPEKKLSETANPLSSPASRPSGALLTTLGSEGKILSEAGLIGEILGYSLHEWQGRKLTDFLHADDVRFVLAALEECSWKLGSFCRGKVRLRAKDGSWHQLEASIINPNNGQITPETLFMAHEATPVTAQTEADSRAEKTRALQRMASHVAQELSNPLTVIFGYTDLILHELHERHPLREKLQEIKTASEKAADWTQQLMLYGRRPALNLRPVDLNAWLNGMNDEISGWLRRGIRLSVKNEKNLGLAQADKNFLGKIILPWIQRAVTAIAGEGEIALETANVTISEAEALQWHGQGAKAGQFTVLRIHDTGVSMDNDELSARLEPFPVQAPVESANDLGLAVSGSLLQEMGGFITVDNGMKGGGTRLQMLFPRTEREPEEKLRSKLPGGRETILLVDDETVLLELAGFVLRECGYTVLEASNGKKALDVLHGQQNRRVDLLLTDVMMPEMDGKELSQKVLAEFPDMKVLFCSGYTADRLRSDGRADTTFELLPKPFTPIVLAKKVREILDR